MVAVFAKGALNPKRAQYEGIFDVVNYRSIDSLILFGMDLAS